MTPAAFVRSAVKADPTLTYGHGRCFAMFALLRRRYGTAAQPWYDGNHVTTRIGGAHYDARGQVDPAPNAIPLNDRRIVSQIRRGAERVLSVPPMRDLRP